MLLNWLHCFFSMIFRSDFARLNFYGFYSVVLEKDDVLISVASIRYMNIYALVSKFFLIIC